MILCRGSEELIVLFKIHIKNETFPLSCLQLWDIRNHKCIQTLTDQQALSGVDEDTLLTAEYDMKRKLLVTGKILHVLCTPMQDELEHSHSAMLLLNTAKLQLKTCIIILY